VGIGTATPVSALEVNGSVSIGSKFAGDVGGFHMNVNNYSGAVKHVLSATPDGNQTVNGHVQYSWDESTHTGLLHLGHDGYDGVGKVMTVASAGGVGIGTTAPSARLEVADNTTYAGVKIRNTDATTTNRWTVLDLRNADDSSLLQLGLVGKGGRAGASQGDAWDSAYVDAYGKDLVLATENANSIRFFTSGGPQANERMRIAAAGNVGIGTTAPAAKLHVSGGEVGSSAGLAQITQAAATNYPTLVVKQTTGGGNANMDQGLVVDVAGSNTGTGNALHVYGQGASRFVVQNGGNVGIGASNPAARLDVAGDIAFSGLLKQGGIDTRYDYPFYRVSTNQYGDISGGVRTGWSNNTGVSWSIYRYINTGTPRASRDAEEKEILTAMGQAGAQHFQPTIVVAKVEWGSALGWTTFPNQIWASGTVTFGAYTKLLTGTALTGYWADGMTTSWGLCGSSWGPVAPGTYIHAHPASSGPGSALVVWPAVVSGRFPLDRANPRWGYFRWMDP